MNQRKGENDYSLPISSSSSGEQQRRRYEQQQQQQQRRRQSIRLPFLFLLFLMISTLIMLVRIFPSFQQEFLKDISTSDGGTAIEASLRAFAKQIQRETTPSSIQKSLLTKPEKTTTTTNADTTMSIDDPYWIDIHREDPLPNPSLTNGNETFSSCLLVMVRKPERGGRNDWKKIEMFTDSSIPSSVFHLTLRPISVCLLAFSRQPRYFFLFLLKK